MQLSNLTAQDNRFCLIDYDKCRDVPAPMFDQSTVLKGIDKTNKAASRMLSVAQIALVCFELEYSESLAPSARREWLGGREDRKYHTKRFDRWVSDTLLGERKQPNSSTAGELWMSACCA